MSVKDSTEMRLEEIFSKKFSIYWDSRLTCTYICWIQRQKDLDEKTYLICLSREKSYEVTMESWNSLCFLLNFIHS